MSTTAKQTFLGIDLGTTSVKISLINEESRILCEKSSVHNAQQHECSSTGRNEECPKQIIRTVLRLLSELDADRHFSQLQGIGISGQMHGVVLWKSPLIPSLDQCKCSPLITWIDGRCDQKFLDSLPKWVDNDGVEKRMASGYGAATLSWFKANGQLDGDWNRAGTIMDFLAVYMTQPCENVSISISTQNAESWGYFDGKSGWTIQDRHDLFPVELFPKIIQPGTVIGRTNVPPSFPGIPSGIPVLVPLGDLQASLLPILSPGDAALHIGTSAQVALIIADQEAVPQMPSLVKVPFFEGNSLLVAASLNGGNVLDCFIRKIGEWSGQLYQTENPAEQDHSALFDRVFQSECPQGTSSALSTQPTFFGERHNPQGGAQVEGWRAETSLEAFLCSIARGIVQNLAQMMPQSVLIAQKVTRLKLVGRAGQKLFEEEAKRQFPNVQVLNWKEGNVSAAFGAALYAKQALALAQKEQ